MTLTPPGPGDTTLLVEVLRAAGVTRQRAATRAALEVTAAIADTGADKARPAALRITRLLADAGRLAEVADRLEAGDLTLVALERLAAEVTRRLTATDTRVGDKRLLDALAASDVPASGEVTRRLAAVPNPTPEETLPVTEPRTPTEAEADRAVVEAEAILDARFPGETIIGEHDREPVEAPVPGVPTVPALVDSGPLPPGHGDDDDLSDLVDVAELTGFDADAELDR